MVKRIAPSESCQLRFTNITDLLDHSLEFHGMIKEQIVLHSMITSYIYIRF